MRHIGQLSTAGHYVMSVRQSNSCNSCLADNIHDELRIMKETYNSSFSDSNIQGLGTDPFLVAFYQQEQVEFFQHRSSTESSVLHVKCTGSMMKRLPEQKVSYILLCCGH